jgi:Transcriptional regulator
LRMKNRGIGLGLSRRQRRNRLVQPILDDLAKRTGELVRLAVIEGDHLTWVAKAQGSKSGLMYSPDTSADVNLPTTANGQAWLACLPQKDIERLVARRAAADGKKNDLKPAAMQELLAELEVVKRRGYAFVSESYQTGTSAIAAAIRELGTGIPLGTVSIAGPTIRMNSARVPRNGHLADRHGKRAGRSRGVLTAVRSALIDPAHGEDAGALKSSENVPQLRTRGPTKSS